MHECRGRMDAQERRVHYIYEYRERREAQSGT